MQNLSDHFWGQRTATIDWCEANYEITRYIAEFWNTVSNLVMILFPIYGIYWSIKHTNHSKKHSTSEYRHFSVPSTIIWCHVGLMFVGIGSWMFHMTLLYSMQLLDELPMIFGSGILIYANYDLILASIRLESKHKRKFSPMKNSKSSIFDFFYNKKLVFSIIFVYCTLVSFVYVFIWPNPVFHEVAYALMVFSIVFENVTLIYRYKLKKRLYLISFIYYMLGFLLWNLDNAFCSYLKSYRQTVENFFGIDAQSNDLKSIVLNSLAVSVKSISEFHSLWHIFTGYASFMTILFLTEVQYHHYLIENKSVLDKQTLYSYKRPVSSKYFNMYYHLNDHLLTTSVQNEKLEHSKKK